MKNGMALLAIPLLLTAVLYTWLFLSAIVRNPTRRHLMILLYNWQTQVAGFLAIAAAMLGVAAVIYQTSESHRAEKERRVRRGSALKSALPMFLDMIAQYLTNSVEAYSTMRRANSGSLATRVLVQVPVLNEIIISNIVDYIETVGQAEGRGLILLLRGLQIHRARAREANRRSVDEYALLPWSQNVVSRIVDTAELYSRCDKLFVYARADGAMPSAVTAEHVKSSLRLLVEDDAERQALDEEVERRVTSATCKGVIWPAT